MLKYKLLMFANVVIWGALGVRRFMLGDVFQGIVGIGLAIVFGVFAIRTKAATPEEAARLAAEEAEKKAQEKAAEQAAAIDVESEEIINE